MAKAVKSAGKAAKTAKPTRAKKYVYFFGDGKAEGKAEMKNLLGGKGANVAEMTNLGIPVPPGFTITTEVCTEYYAKNRRYLAVLKDHVDAALAKVERIIGKKFGDPNDPLLVSVRSGARSSMPGMMDTVLNIGLTTKARDAVDQGCEFYQRNRETVATAIDRGREAFQQARECGEQA